jgi:hypothetical protein
MLRPYRLATVLALLLVLLGGSLSPAAARPLQHAPSVKVPSVASQLSLSTLWHKVVRLLEKSGSAIDPFGHPVVPAGAQSASDSGSAIDPFGGR